MPLFFASAQRPEYYWQKPHYNWGNYVVHSEVYKKMFNKIRIHYDWQPAGETQMPFFIGVVPNMFWTYGSIDYSFNKYHRHYQSHDDWYPDRKAKTLGSMEGGPIDKTGK